MGKRQRFTKEFKREALRLGRDYMLLHMPQGLSISHVYGEEKDRRKGDG
jgi:hypothetical protein